MDPAAIARQTWEWENNIVTTADTKGDSYSAASDAIFFYDEAAVAKSREEKLWASDPHYFKRVKISALALLKMVVHARSGSTIEVMGLVQGKTDGDAIIVMDAFALPVDGTETRVNAQADDMSTWWSIHKLINRCFQQYQEPFLAVVIDPTRTVSAGKVDIGAFRTYPEGYNRPNEPLSEYQTIPLNKIEDFGVHCKQYYALDITYFKSSLDCHLLDLLWNKYWVNTLSSSPLLGSRDYVAGQISDLAVKIEQADNQLANSRIASLVITPQKMKEEEFLLRKISRDSAKITVEQVHRLISQVIKDFLFNSVRQYDGSCTKSTGPETIVET